jgi:hypothetical protein
MKLLLLGMLVLTLGGCLATVRDPIVYTQAEVDAINAEAACKSLARTLLQATRCVTRR